ncbi:helix-turn-helix domain-containing protein [Thioclava sp. GXIMD4215]|uniref:helix-turn-helix domain-containing protein n=1 Tax=Thioclava sp. GXIMD4215 TaxID=3131928 RepID=UPI003249A721
MKREFIIDGEDKAKEPFIYRMSGLDDVVLLNGFTRHETDYGEGVSIDNIDSLHDAIAIHIITTKKNLTPKEFRFLRSELEMTQDQLGGYLKISGQTVARYEKGETEISGPADQLIRVAIILKMMPADKIAELFEEIQEAAASDEITTGAPVRFKEAAGVWEEVCCA